MDCQLTLARKFILDYRLPSTSLRTGRGNDNIGANPSDFLRIRTVEQVNSRLRNEGLKDKAFIENRAVESRKLIAEVTFMTGVLIDISIRCAHSR